jgi:hypothetical protein
LNANTIGSMWRHYFRNPKYKEFILYGVSFSNLKRVLTLRTQFIMRNDTLKDYEVKITSIYDKEKSKTDLKLLKSGASLPLPEHYNTCSMQLRLATDSEAHWSQDWPIYAIKKIIKVNDPGFINHGDTFTFFRKQ